MLTEQENVSTQLHEGHWGVISYVPADRAWCEWLYFTLNGYPVPKILSKHVTRHGFPLPQSISVFPNPDDPCLGENYAEALSAGRYLIVICSPNSAHCAEVDRHIRVFKKAGGEERILVVVVEGAPGTAPTLTGKQANDWLPPWLRWRLDSQGRFQEAERSEPQILDARPGQTDLDNLMSTLLSTLLDIPRGELEVFSTPRPHVPQARTPAPLDEEDEAIADQVWDALNPAATPSSAATAPDVSAPAVPPHPVAAIPPGAKPRGISPLVLGLGATAFAALALAGFLWMRSGSSGASGVGPTHPASAPASQTVTAKSDAPDVALPMPVKEAPPAPPAPRPIPQEPPAVASAPVAAPVEVKPDQRPVAPVAPPQVAPPAVATSAIIPVANTSPMQPAAAPAFVTREPVARSIPAPAPTTVIPSTLQQPLATPAPGEPELLTPEEVAKRAADVIWKEAVQFRTRADEITRTGGVSEALPYYLHALDSTERYAALRADDPAATLEAAKLCLIVGALQSNYSSTAEARLTFQTGVKMISKLKVGKDIANERAQTLHSLEEQIRRLQDDAARRHVDRG